MNELAAALVKSGYKVAIFSQKNESIFKSAALTPGDIRKANDRIKLQRVSLKVKNNQIWMQGTLPLRPGSDDGLL
ncbi:MAG: hypothetical protein AB4040_06350 [Synechococcus sp.]